jgi:hypothetical protein
MASATVDMIWPDDILAMLAVTVFAAIVLTAALIYFL